MNDPLKQQEVLDFLLRNKVDCGAIIETHVKAHHVAAVKRKCFSRFSLVTNLDSHHGGRIWVLWDPAVITLRVMHQGSQFLHCSLLHLSSQRSLLVTFVYALNRAPERLELWDRLRSFSTSSNPWICLGDFNVSLTSDERVGCVVHEREMLEFRECLRDCALEDHPFTGGIFTWHNKQESFPKWAKLDRLLANRQWFLDVPSTVAFLPPGISDHTHILLTVVSSVALHKPYRYLNCWSMSPGFCERVSSDWLAPVFGGRIYSLFSKLRRLRRTLKTIHTSEFMGLSSRVAEAKARL
ncbi:hypothetical protein RND81_03G025700 [Saponaria officinalis]|uniref:Endonuclease/exonuclease/phosphatase domain-containing protein n=1 Tax=Saponaria officinalis TaxID=3572 RepID=A0AAW1M345_SAPOF